MTKSYADKVPDLIKAKTPLNIPSIHISYIGGVMEIIYFILLFIWKFRAWPILITGLGMCIYSLIHYKKEEKLNIQEAIHPVVKEISNKKGNDDLISQCWYSCAREVDDVINHDPELAHATSVIIDRIYIHPISRENQTEAINTYCHFIAKVAQKNMRKFRKARYIIFNEMANGFYEYYHGEHNSQVCIDLAYNICNPIVFSAYVMEHYCDIMGEKYNHDDADEFECVIDSCQ